MTANQGDGRADDPAPEHRIPTWQVASPAVASPMVDNADHDEARPSVASRFVSIALAFIVGLVYGAVGTVAHPLSFTIGSVTIPWGLILSLVGVLALFVGFRLVLGERLPVLAAAVGVVGIVALFSLESAGGSVLIQQGVAGLVWVLGPALLAALVISFPALPARGGPERVRRTAPADRLDGPDAKEFPTP